MMNLNVVFGTITAADEQKNMTVELENGDRGIVAFAEVSRRKFDEDFPASQLVGRRLSFVAGERREDGKLDLSARAYEDWQFDEIKTAFENRTRNVYEAELVSVTPSIAYYRLAQGVNGGVTLGDFAFAYTNGFTAPGMRLPRTATVVVKQILDNGRIDLAMRPAFGTFEQNIARLGIEEGSEFDAPVTNKSKNGASSVAMLSPNLTVLCGSAPVGATARLRCIGIDHENRRLRIEVIDPNLCPAQPFDYESCLLSAEELGDYIDLEAFDAQIRPAAIAKPEPKAVEIDFSIPQNTTVSPFAVEDGETIAHSRTPFNKHALLRDIESGVLDDRHRQVCQAVCDLRYANLFLIQRYLCAKYGIMIGNGPLKNILTRLAHHNVLTMMNFHREGGAKSTPVYICGGLYRDFMSEYPRLQAWEYTNQDASIPKTRLASNQLMIGLMNSCDVTEYEPHPYLLFNMGTEGEIRVRPRHSAMIDGKRSYVEGVRSNWDFESFANKLNRYQSAFDFTGEDAEVLVAVETRDIAAELAERVHRELKLSFPVRFCADLDALPHPQFVTAEPTRAAKVEDASGQPEKKSEPKGLLSKLKQRIFGKAA